MADYPSTLIQVVGTEVIDTDGTVTDLAVSGKPRQRSFFTIIRNRITVVHDLDATEMAVLDAHFAADHFNVFAFTFQGDSTVFNVRYMSPPRKRIRVADRWSVTVSLIVI